MVYTPPPAYIYAAEDHADALALVAAIDALLGCPKEGCESTTYATPAEHPTDGRWYVLANGGGVPTETWRLASQLPVGTPEPVALDTSWFPVPSV